MKLRDIINEIRITSRKLPLTSFRSYDDEGKPVYQIKLEDHMSALVYHWDDEMMVATFNSFHRETFLNKMKSLGISCSKVELNNDEEDAYLIPITYCIFPVDEIRIIPDAPKNNNDLLAFLQRNKVELISQLQHVEPDITGDEIENEIFWSALSNEEIEIDGLTCPSIGDGILYFSFAVDPNVFDDDSEDDEVMGIELKGFPFYYIKYSI